MTNDQQDHSYRHLKCTQNTHKVNQPDVCVYQDEIEAVRSRAFYIDKNTKGIRIDEKNISPQLPIVRYFDQLFRRCKIQIRTVQTRQTCSYQIRYQQGLFYVLKSLVATSVQRIKSRRWFSST